MSTTQEKIDILNNEIAENNEFITNEQKTITAYNNRLEDLVTQTAAINTAKDISNTKIGDWSSSNSILNEIITQISN